ncbi:hypothetical protein FQA39_LY12644 [Lamprigera yunnana]|nr:hypothetical protein FQA39_LY12644 [Lamprigera yunnana]
MSFARELLQVLNDTEEPLTKRLKVADNAFKSVELPLQHKESFLLKWLNTMTKSSDVVTWDLLLNWLQSPQMQHVTHEDFCSLTNVLPQRLVHHNAPTSVIVNCILEVLKNKSFRVYFKYDLGVYCEFVANILSSLKCDKGLHTFMINGQLFHRDIVQEDFYSYFFKYVLKTLCQISSRNEQAFIDASKLVKKCLFAQNHNIFVKYLNELFKETDEVERLPLPHILFQYLQNNSESESIKLVFYVFCTTYSDFDVLFKVFVIILQILGFKMNDFFALSSLKQFQSIKQNESINVLTEMCKILCKSNCEFTLVIKDQNFTHCLGYIVKNTLHIMKPNEESHNFLNVILLLNPLVFEKQLNAVLEFLFTNTCQYDETLWLNLFKVNSKLHRIPNLISSITDVFKSLIRNRNLDFTISHNVLNYFTVCVTSLASLVVQSLFKILLNELEIAVEDLGNERMCSYAEFIGAFLCQLLMSARVAEHTISTSGLKSFERYILELKEILKKFGVTLVNLEHNPRLMQVYLNICHKWGELYMSLVYYSNEVILQKGYDNDYSATNITYLHSYLTREQWQLISQRIANFGEKPCKQIMQNLCTQRIKALLLFENNVNKDILTSVTSNILSSLDDQSEDLLLNPFVLQNLIIPECQNSTVKFLVKQIIKNGDFEKVQLLCDNYEITGKVLYVCLCSLNKTFGKSNRLHCLTTRFLKNYNGNLFESCDIAHIFDVVTSFVNTVDEDKVHTYIDLIKNIPIVQFNNPFVLENVFTFMVAMIVDLSNCNLRNSEIGMKCENVALGIAQSLNCSDLVIGRNFFKVIVENFVKRVEVFGCITMSFFRPNRMHQFQYMLDMIINNLDNYIYLDCAITFLGFVKRTARKNLSEQVQSYCKNLYRKFMPIVRTNDLAKIEKFTKVYAILLNCHFNDESKDLLNDLLYYLDDYVNGIINSDKYIEGAIYLFFVIVKKQSRCDAITDDLINKIWDSISNIKIKHETKDFANLVALTLKHISEQNFELTLSKLLKITETSLQTDQFQEKLKVWIAIASCKLRDGHKKIFQNNLESLIYQVVLPHMEAFENSVYKDVVHLEVTILQNSHLLLSASLLESVLITVSLIGKNLKHFNLALVLLENMIKSRRILTVDYLPTYLRRYRMLLNQLCVNSNSDLALSVDCVQELSDYAHKFEKLTKTLVHNSAVLTRISPYLIADILKHFENITIYANVKIHLNNCLYLLMSICDVHAVSFLKRVLSVSSTEMFKMIYENYNKYYKFLGKV